MNCQDFREDLEAYAIGALDAGQRRDIETHLRDCDGCSQIVHAYGSTVDYLAFSVPLYHASPRLKERIMGGIGVISRPAVAAISFRSRWVGMAAAVALVAIAVGGIAWAIVLSAEVGRLSRENHQLASLTQLDSEQRTALLKLQSDLTSARFEQRQLVTTLAEQGTLLVIALDPDLIPSELAGTALAPQSTCSYVWSTKQDVGALTCKNMPYTAFNLEYELWATKGDKTLPIGTFEPNSEGLAQLLVKFPDDFDGPLANMFVTLEQSSTVRSRPSQQVILERQPQQQAAR